MLVLYMSVFFGVAYLKGCRPGSVYQMGEVHYVGNLVLLVRYFSKPCVPTAVQPIQLVFYIEIQSQFEALALKILQSIMFDPSM